MTKQIEIRTDKPTNQRAIVALLSEEFCGVNGFVDILYRHDFCDFMHPEGYYDCHGELVPESAILKWFEIPEEMFSVSKS